MDSPALINPQRRRTRPRGVTIAVTLQLLLASTFLISAGVALFRGDQAQRAAETELLRQGFRPQILDEQHVRFDESPLVVVLATVIGLGLGVLAVRNFAGSRISRIITWIVQPILLVAGGFIVTSQVFTTRLIESAFRDDPALSRIDVEAVVRAAVDQFPAGYPYVVYARLILITAGSLLVIILLATRPSHAHFRAGRRD